MQLHLCNTHSPHATIIPHTSNMARPLAFEDFNVFFNKTVKQIHLFRYITLESTTDIHTITYKCSNVRRYTHTYISCLNGRHIVHTACRGKNTTKQTVCVHSACLPYLHYGKGSSIDASTMRFYLFFPLYFSIQELRKLLYFVEKGRSIPLCGISFYRKHFCVWNVHGE